MSALYCIVYIILKSFSIIYRKRQGHPQSNRQGNISVEFKSNPFYGLASQPPTETRSEYETIDPFVNGTNAGTGDPISQEPVNGVTDNRVGSGYLAIINTETDNMRDTPEGQYEKPRVSISRD